MASILGISAFYHDSAAALVTDGIVTAAAQEERFTRKKHDARFPSHAIASVLAEAGLSISEVDHVVFYEKPFVKFERLLETYVAYAPKGLRSFSMALPLWLREKLFQKDILLRELKKLDSRYGGKNNLLFSEHHLSHAASAYYPSPFDEALVLTVDGVGEWATTTVSMGRGRDLKILEEIHFPHSLGLLYSAFTYYTGFKVNSGEYKLMGLAPYGEPRFRDLILQHLIDLKEDGSFRLNQTYFNYAAGLTMTNRKFANLFGQPARRPDTDPLTPFHMDIAASVQAVLEEALLRLSRSLARKHRVPNLCLAGGVALNCVANGKVLRDGAFKEVWIQPAAGDAGGAVGAALAAWHLELGQPRVAQSPDGMRGSFLGPRFEQGAIDESLSEVGAVFETLTQDQMIHRTCEALSAGQAVGWFQGRMEFGPRSLGGRSILADPRSEKMQQVLNLKVKFRESFRPFAPSVLREDLEKWFELDRDSPYMLLVADIQQERRRQMTEQEKALFGIDKLNVRRSDIPAVTHVDFSARVQTVHRETNPLYYTLIEQFKQLTGCPVLVNTSFNVRGEPIVCTPADAYRCFMGTDLDLLVVGNSVLHKNRQPSQNQMRYENAFEMD